MSSSSPDLRGTDPVVPGGSIPAVLRGIDPVFPNSRFPAWVLLDEEVQIDEEDCTNETTTAETRTTSGRLVKVSFFAADPPYLSHFRVYCPGLTKKFDYLGKPSVLHSVDDLALISITFGCGSKTEYFFYRAGRGRPPLLQHLRGIGSYLERVQFLASVGFLPGGSDGNGDSFVLAALGSTLVAGQYELHVFQSQNSSWTKNVLDLGTRRLSNVDKVIAMGDSELVFVDLLKGILICDVLSEKPTYRFIVLPKLLPNNQSENSPGRSSRDVAVSTDGFRCVELEARWRRVAHESKEAHDILPEDVSSADVLYDSVEEDLEEEDLEEQEIYEYLGWRYIVWSRTLSSTGWHKECLVDADAVTVNKVAHTAFLHDFGGSTTTLKTLFTSVPTFGMDGNNSLYMISKVNHMDQDFCVLKLDIKKNELETVSSVITQRTPFSQQTYTPCSMSKFLNSDSDGQNVSWSVPYVLQSTEESDSQYITASTHYNPCTEYYCYPEEPWPLRQPLSMPSDGQNVSWSVPYVLQSTEESDSQYIAASIHYNPCTEYYCYPEEPWPLRQPLSMPSGDSFWSTTEEDVKVLEPWMGFGNVSPHAMDGFWK